MKKALFQQWRLMCCGDRYGFHLWLNDENVNRSRLKEMPEDIAWTSYQQWLAQQPMCGHKKCESRHDVARQLWAGNSSQVMWQAYKASHWTPKIKGESEASK